MIRKAEPTEIDMLLALTQACAQKMISDGIFQWDTDYPSKEAFSEDCKRQELYVLLKAKEIIGCITLSEVKDLEYNLVQWLSNDGRNLYIHRLAIHPNHQHQGHAKSLMDFAESYAQENGFESIRLDTFSENKRNQRFYLARNYTKVGEVYFPRQSDYPFYCYEKMLPN